VHGGLKCTRPGVPRSPGLATLPLPHGAETPDIRSQYRKRVIFRMTTVGQLRDDPKTDQCFKSGISFASSSSNDMAPSLFAPLMKKVGVACTFN
jgi:hypothetical protein